ncbi:hypothetical protein ACFXDH_15915 [Streptomyces sp. NPDC059467]|uniref:hypothetical protein n=1 Tax=Streptomyces sp. NPDC059467 TaxID=3346844 RepID=UPI003673C55D
MAVQDALGTRSRFTRLELPHAEHRLGLWFRDRPEDRREFAALLLEPRGRLRPPAGPSERPP